MIDEDRLKELRNEVYSKLAFAYKVIDVTVKFPKPKLQQPGYNNFQREKGEDYYDEHAKMPPPKFSGEEMARADRILDCFGKLVTNPDDSRALAHYSRKRGKYGLVKIYCKKHRISKVTYKKRRDRAALILISSDEWRQI